jgi:hypothetical protein
MVKTVVEGGVSPAAIPGWMVTKEIQFSTLQSVRVIDSRSRLKASFEIMQPIWKLKHQQQYQTKILIVFEQILRNEGANAK